MNQRIIMGNLRVAKFTVASNCQSEDYLDPVEIKQASGLPFLFESEGDLSEFMDELRQTFECIFVFGCNVIERRQSNNEIRRAQT